MLRRLRRKLSLKRRRRGFHSRFGGHWTDRLDAEAQLEARLRDGRIRPEERELVAGWIRDGFAVLPGAVDDAVTDRVRDEVERLWAEGRPGVMIELGGDYRPLEPGASTDRAKLLDLHVLSAVAREAIFAPRVRRFLELVFEEDALAFQSLTFQTGSEQPVHQDTAYVVVTPPMSFVASWIALEDIQEGTGELVYYPGSHRLPEHLFRGGSRNWNRERDGDDANFRYLEDLVRRAEAAGLERQTFLPRKNDVLFWANDLAHGGGPITREASTRRSLVTHYCPASADPYYTAYLPEHGDRRRAAPGCWYSSSYYPLPPA